MPSKNIENTSANKWAQSEQVKHFCESGCGNPKKVTWYHKYEGIPSYINGHKPQNIVDMGFGRKRKIWGGKFEKRKQGRNYYYAHLPGNIKHFNLGTDLNLAKKFLFVYTKARKNELHYSRMINFLDHLTNKVKNDIASLNALKIDRSLIEARKALAELRKVIKEKTEVM